MNLFEQAIIKRELLNYALGKEIYFVADRDYGDHSVILSWTNHIIPLIDLKGLEYVNKKIEMMFIELLNSNLDNEVKNESLLYHLHVYYYLNSEGKISANNLASLNNKLLESLNNYIYFLENNNISKAKSVTNAITLIQLRGGLVTEPT